MSIVARQIAGYSCVVVGVVGLAMPILPGIPVLLIGLKLLGLDHLVTGPFKRVVERFRK